MAEPPRDKKAPPVPKLTSPPAASKAGTAGGPTNLPKVILPSLAESTAEVLPSIVVDLGAGAQNRISDEATLILPAKVIAPQQAVKTPTRTGTAPKPASPPQAPPVSLSEATLILNRDEMSKALAKATAPALKPPSPAPKVPPVAPPAAIPVAPPVKTPAAIPVAPPVKTPAAIPVAPPVKTPAAIPVAAPVAKSIGPARALVPRSPAQAPPRQPPPVHVPPQPPPPSQQRQQQRVRELIHRFEIAALLDVLYSMGYRDDQIEFMSNPVQSHRAALLEDIEFLETPPRVLILVNLGLLSGQGPIPSYFYQLLGEQRDTSMTEFLWFFDNALLRQRFAGLFPERDPSVVPDWGEVNQLQLALLQLGSPTGMHWLFRLVYPELSVSVRRSVQRRRVRTSGILMGESALGTGCAFGGFTQVPVGGIDVRLLCEEWETPAGKPWAHVAEQRLKQLVMPALDSSDLFLTVILVFLDRQSFARLIAQNFLGYEPIASPPIEDQPPPVQQVILFQGEVGHNPH